MSGADPGGRPSEHQDPADRAADGRARRDGFNPLMAAGLIVLAAIAAFILFARFA